MKEFRFGVLTHGRRTAPEWRAFARQVESLGYDVLHMAHHFSLPLPPPFVALAFAAEATERLRLGTLVYDVNMTHPAVVAQEAAWTARLSGERFELGVGAGWLARDYEVLGQPFDPPARRVARLEEALEIIHRCWNVAPATFGGSSAAVDGLDNGTECSRLHIPLLVGGGGPRVLALAGRHADIVSIAPNMRSGRLGSESARTANAEALTRQLTVLATAAAERFTALELHVTMTALIRREESELLERTARAFGVCPDTVGETPSVLVGDDDDWVEALRRRREKTGISFYTVPEKDMVAFAPVLAGLKAGVR